MKKSFKILILCVVCIFSIPIIRAALSDDLVGCWPFDTNFTDIQSGIVGDSIDQIISPNGKIGNGTLNSTGQADDIVTLGSPESQWDSVFNSDFSVSMWVNFFASEDQGNLISKWWDGSTRVWELAIIATNQVRLTHTNAGGTSTQNLNTGFSFVNNNWYHVIVTFNSNGSKFVYVNDTLIASVVLVQASSNDAPLTLTASNFSGSLRNGANADIDEVAIWNRTLTKSEITSLYNNSFGQSCISMIGGEPPSDPCTPPASGNYDVDCSDACQWDTPDEIPGNITLTGTGTVTLSSAWTFTGVNQYIFQNAGCTFNKASGAEYK